MKKTVALICDVLVEVGLPISFLSLQTTSENYALYSVPLVQLFACVSCDLACELSAFFDSTTLDAVGNLPVNLISEWKEFFSQGIHSLLLPLLVTVTGK